MTVCVAAFAAKSKAIILVSDKAVTYGGSGPIPEPAMQADTGIKKIRQIGQSGWWVLVSGSPSSAEKVVRTAAETLTASPILAHSCSEMMGCVSSAYAKVRRKAIKEQILEPRLLTEDLLVARSASLLPFPDPYFLQVSDEVAAFNLQCHLLVCGFDKTRNPRPHIFSISHPGTADSKDLEGFDAIGIGSQVAIGTLLDSHMDRGDDLEEALYEVFDAKAHAELIQGVGFDWDARIIPAGKKAVPVKRAILNLVGRVWEDATASPFHKAFGKFRDRDWKKRLKSWARQVLR